MKLKAVLLILVPCWTWFATWAVTERAGAQQAIEQRFRELDVNNDGKLTPDELPQPAVFQALDLDGDGQVTPQEAARAALGGRLREILGSRGENEPANGAATPAEPSRPFESPVREGPKRLAAGDHGIGRFLEDFEYRDLAGQSHRLSDDASAPLTVIAMTSTTCPLSKKYLPTLIELTQAYASQDVRWILVNPVATDRADDMVTEAARFGDGIRYVADGDGAIVRKVGATSTTDVILLDGSRTVLYQGAIDDQYGFGYSRETPRQRYLVDAIDAAFAGQPIRIAATTAPGCLLERASAGEEPVTITYHQQVARLLQRHCVECHRDGGVAPFPLDRYEDAVAHAPMIREVIERGIMPPWFAAPLAGETVSPWINHRALADAEKRELFAWLDQGMPAGPAADAPRPRQFPEGWLIGKPDAVFEFAKPVPVKATGTMPYQNVVVETNLPEDRWVQAIELRPGNPSVVHHVLVFVRGPNEGDGERDDAADESTGYWGIYVPGNSTLVYPDGYAKRIPRGAKLRFQMHYTPNGTATEDSTRIGLIFAKQPPRHEVKVAGIVNTRLRIPPGADHHQEVARLRVPTDVKVLAFLPHMHLRGKAARYDLIRGDDTRTLLDIPRYDFNWQLLYRYAEPIDLRAGDTLRFTAWYDNSDRNPANPDPTRTVRWGPQTDDEMHLGYVEYIVPGEVPSDSRREDAKEGTGGDTTGGNTTNRPRNRIRNAVLGNAVPEEGRAAGDDLFRRLDIDGDGFVTREEVRERLPENPNASGALFDRLDRNGDGKLDEAEFAAVRSLLQR